MADLPLFVVTLNDRHLPDLARTWGLLDIIRPQIHSFVLVSRCWSNETDLLNRRHSHFRQIQQTETACSVLAYHRKAAYYQLTVSSPMEFEYDLNVTHNITRGRGPTNSVFQHLSIVPWNTGVVHWDGGDISGTPKTGESIPTHRSSSCKPQTVVRYRYSVACSCGGSKGVAKKDGSLGLT